jgi:hypothetical protein
VQLIPTISTRSTSLARIVDELGWTLRHGDCPYTMVNFKLETIPPG